MTPVVMNPAAVSVTGATVTTLDRDKLPGGSSPRWVSGEKYDRAYAHAERLSRERAVLVQAILDIDANAFALAEDEDGFVACGYFVPIGPIHRALGSIGHGAPKNPDVMPPEWFRHLLNRARV